MGKAQEFVDNLTDDDISSLETDTSAIAIAEPPPAPQRNQSLAQQQADAIASQSGAQSQPHPAVDASLSDASNLSLGPHFGQEPAQPIAQQAPAAAAAPPQQAAAPEVPSGIRQYLAAQGMTGMESFEDDASAMQALLSYLQTKEQEIEAQRQQAAWYQHQALLAQQTQYQAPQQVAQQAAQPQQQVAAQPQQAAWKKPPEWNPAWNALLTRDADGNLVAVPGAQPDLPQKYRAHQDYLASMQAKMFEDPASFLLKEAGLEQHVRQVAQQIAQEQYVALQQQSMQQAEQQRMQQFSQKTAAQHGHWMYQLDPYGQPLRNPQSGEFLLTPDGQWQRAKMIELVNNGVRPELAWNMAYELNIGRVAQEAAFQNFQAQQAAAQNGQPTNGHAAQLPPNQAQQQAKNDAFLRARRQPNRNGTQPLAVNGHEPPQNLFEGIPREQRFGMIARQVAAQAGIHLDD